jgi:cell division protein FtsW
MSKTRTVDRFFLVLVAFLTLGGFFVFASASLGLHGRDGADFASVVANQFLLGIMLGSVLLYAGTKIHYTFWRKHALWILVGTIVLMLFVFIPHIGFEHGGAKRWITLGFTTFQPAEILKFAVVVYLAMWFATARKKIEQIRWGLIPFLIILGIAGILLLLQPDTGTLLVIGGAATAMYVVAGATGKHVVIIGLVGVLVFGAVLLVRPYTRERMMTYFQPGTDMLGSDWQVNQSLIAIGSGGVMGRGFGQSIQKFSYLPEPIGDSVFAVASEEFGFVGALSLVVGFLLFLYRGLYIARRAPDVFSGLLVSGVVIMIVWQSFINIGAMLNIFPLTGLPLLFVSHGGTALAVTLAQTGIILNVSKYIKKE